MSVSKLWAIMAGIDEVKHLSGAAKELDRITGYTENGGRGEGLNPGDTPEERLADYYCVEEKRKHPVLSENAGTVELSVHGTNGEPLLAELKLFPMGEEEQGFPYSNGKTDFYRRYTDTRGTFSMRLPAGRYFVTAGKGSEYSIAQTILTVPEYGTAAWQAELCRFVNLTEQGWYAGDLHHHSVYSSPLYPPQGTDYVYDTPKEVAESMQAAGLTFGALSDHHNVENHRVWETFETGEFLPILSKEISTSNGHVLSLNVDKDIIYEVPEKENRTPEALRNEFIRICNEIHELGGHPQLNHPREESKSIAFPEEFTDMVGIFDTMEIWNGSHPMDTLTKNGRAFRLWLSLLDEGRFIAATTGSDTHEVSLEFWLDSYAYLFGLCHAVKEQYETFSEEQKETADYFFGYVENNIDLLEKWGKLSLSSGCVRTYVHAPGERTPENLLSHLKQGNSFLTNGPLLMAEIDGRGMGETVPVAAGQKNVLAKLTILSNRAFSQDAKVYVWQNGGRKAEFLLPEAEEKNGSYDYSCELSVSLENTKWVFFAVRDDITNQAMTNPVFFSMEE